MKKQNCANCENLGNTSIGNCFTFYCKRTEMIVPHASDADDKTVIFWRIPMSCQLSDGDVHKREDRAPEKTWTKLHYTEL